MKEMMTTLVSFYWSVLLGLLHVGFSVVRGFYRIFSVASTSDNQVQGTKTIKVTETISFLSQLVLKLRRATRDMKKE